MPYRTKLNPFTGELQKVFEESPSIPAINTIDQVARDNNVLNQFYIQAHHSLTANSLFYQFIDEFETDEFIDISNSSNYTYDSLNKLYHPSGGDSADMLFHFNGNNGDAFTVDSVANYNMSFLGNPQINTSEFKFGNSSIFFPGNVGDYCTISPSLFLGTTNFELDFWIKFPQVPTSQQDVFNHHLNSNNFWRLNWSPNRWEFQWITASGGSVNFSAPFTVIANTWYHVAVIRNNNSFDITIDGASIGNSNSSASLNSIPGGSFYFGRGNSLGQELKAYVDEVRLTKNSNILNIPFSVPTSEYNLNRDNMVLTSSLISPQGIAENGRIILRQENIDTIELNTELTVEMTRDGGNTWTSGILVEKFPFNNNTRILTADINLISQPSITNLGYRIKTLNQKDTNIHAVGMLWS